MQAEIPPAEVLENFVTEYKLNISPKLTTEQRYELINVFY